jgi:acyl-coenzyme A thioesterase PaaI-like protein
VSRPWKVGDVIVQQGEVNERRALVIMTEILFTQDGPIRWITVGTGTYLCKTQAELESQAWRLLEDLPVEP